MINTTYLKYFYDTIRFGSVSKASSHNFVTQSAVSQGIVKLERSLNVMLLSHKSNRISITPEGKKVFESCRSIFQTIDNLIQTIHNKDGEYYGDLIFSCTHSMALSLLPQALSKFNVAAPKVVPKIFPGNIGLVKEWLKQGKIEFGIVLENEDVSSLDKIPLYSGSFKLYQSVERKDIGSIEEIITTEPRPEVNTLKNDFFRKYGIQLKSSMEISSWEVIANLVCSNVGVGFFPDFLALSQQRIEKIIPCNYDIAPIPYEISAVYSKREQLSRNAELFISYFQDCLAGQLLCDHVLQR
jgi:DNA-binding transcriptional LysR family regulator